MGVDRLGHALGGAGMVTTPLADLPTPSDLPVRAWDTMFDEDDIAHVVPKIGQAHELSSYCWCHPVFRPDAYDEPAWSHNMAQ